MAAGEWLRKMADCLDAAEREQIGSPCPVVDHELIAPLDGGPDDLVAWCVCRTPEEKRRFVDTEQARFVSALRRKMLAAGFPESAIASLRVQATSRGEIEAMGGRFSALR